MNGKKKFILTIVITALATVLVTDAARNIAYVARGGTALHKISAVKKMLTDYSLFETDEEKLADYASMAMAAAVEDPYTVYYPAEEFASYRDNLVLSYVGIGATLGADTENDTLVVVSPTEDGPAERSGIKSGDVILLIDGKSYSSSELSEAAMYLKSGEEGTTVTITVRGKSGGEREITVTREKIIKKSVKSEMLPNGVGYVRITGFESKGDVGEKSTYDEFSEHIDALKTAGMTSMVIDLRDNPGGDLNVVCQIADSLLPECLITYTEDKNGKRETINSGASGTDIPIAVLVNGGSASASEVLTGALKDNGRATVIGEKTYGKGIVQTVYPFSDGSGISITTAKYYTPSGECIHGIGIEPDVWAELKSDKAISELTYEEDNQLQKAVEVLTASPN